MDDLLREYEKADPMIDGMIMRRYLALIKDFTRGEREFTPQTSSPYKFTAEMIESYKRYECEQSNPTTECTKNDATESNNNDACLPPVVVKI